MPGLWHAHGAHDEGDGRLGTLDMPGVREASELEGGVMAVDRETLRKFRLPSICSYCHGENILLRRTVSGSGINMFFWMCVECQSHAKQDDIWIPHAVISYWIGQGRFKTPEDIPVHVEYASKRRCAICRRYGAEYHHWAPQSMAKFFGDDWAKWPGEYLCKEHHDLWHEIVTPHLHGRRSTKRAKEVMAWAQEQT